MSNRFSVAYGDGIGPEIMKSVLKILKHVKTDLEPEIIKIGEDTYNKGFSSGIEDDTWNVIKRNKAFLKAPLTTPLGKGYKSLNITFRRTLELFVNICPSLSYYPFINILKKINIVIIRENEEDLYSGIEYKITPNSTIAMKLLSTFGCEKVIRYAFEYARLNNRQRITCITQSNIMKITEGCFQNIFFKIASEYSSIKVEHMLADSAFAKLVTEPEHFDVIVTLNLYGDLMSKMLASVSGSVGLLGSANIGQKYAMFEAVHGSATDIAGKNIANPSGLLNAAIMMLQFLKESKAAETIHNALLKTIEDGLHTMDVYNAQRSKKQLTTSEFTDAIISNLGQKPKILANQTTCVTIQNSVDRSPCRSLIISELVGIDFFLKVNFQLELIKKLQNLDNNLPLKMVSSKGLVIWPKRLIKPKVDFYRFRFLKADHKINISQANVLKISGQIIDLGLNIVSTVNLYKYNNKNGFTLAQGE